MNAHLIKPLALAVGLALAASGCSSHTQNQNKTASAATVSKSAPAATTARASTASAAPTVTIPAAQPIAFTLDNKYQPCDDFGAYVDAKWDKANPIPADATRWVGFNKLHKQVMLQQKQILETAAYDVKHHKGSALEQKLGTLYAAAMDTAAVNKLGYTPIKPELAKIDALKNTAEVVNFINSSYANGDGFVFGFGSGADQKNAMKQIGYVDQAGLGLPTKEYYLSKKPHYKKLRAAYVKYIAKSLELVGTPAARAKKQAQSVLALETKLAKASLTPTQLLKPSNQYHFVTVAQADKISPNFNWQKFFKAQGLEVGKGFSLSQPKFIKEFNKLLVKVPVAQWQAYLKFHLVSEASPSLSKAFQKNHFDFYAHTLGGQPQQKPRWKRAVRMVNEAMGMGLGKLYVAKYFPPATKARAEKLVANIHNAMADHIKNLTWMGPATKKKALKKLSMVVPNIGYPSKGNWRNWDGLSIQSGDLFANLRAAMKYNYDWNIGKIGTKTNRHQWQMTPQTVNAYYSDATNTINFPAAILQPPFFYPHGDPAVNYGGIGYVIGHETTHGFDSDGSKFNGYGDKVDWWTKKDRERFDKLTAALSKQYDAYTPVPGKPDLHINGKQTLREDIADLGGLNLAYTALQNVLKTHPKEAKEKINGHTEDQRFFLSSARVWEGTLRKQAAELQISRDPHPLPKIRRFASASNMPQFAKAFECKADSKMVRKNPVHIWTAD